MYKLLLNFMVSSGVYRSFIPNKNTFIKYCFTELRQHLANFMDLAGIVDATVYKTEPIITGLGHGKLS